MKLRISELPENANILIDEMKGGLSVLKSFGAWRLRLEMLIPGFLTRLIVTVICHKAGGIKKLKDCLRAKRMVKSFLDWCAPYCFVDDDYDVPIISDNRGIVLGFNHPSLGEILRIISLVMDKYPGRNYFFPVNLPWYESLMPVADKLEAVGLNICPMITPSTHDKIMKIVKKHEDIEKLNAITQSLTYHYMSTLSETVARCDIAIVAPSATRQATIFKTYKQSQGTERIDPRTISLIQAALKRSKVELYDYVPLLVIPPEKHNRGLNLFKKYQFASGTLIGNVEAENLFKQKDDSCRENRLLDVFFLGSLAEMASDLHHQELVSPSPIENGLSGLNGNSNVRHRRKNHPMS